MSSAEAVPAEEAVDRTNLIVNYLPSSVTEDSLRKLFEPFGTLERVKLMTDKRTGASATYGFVKYTREEDAKKAIEALNGKALESKTLRVDYSRPHTDVSLYVGNFLPSVTEEQLRKVFEKYGNILDCKILTDPATGASRGCGFVHFEKRSDGMDAIGGLKDVILSGFCEKALTVRVAQPHAKQQDHRHKPQQRQQRRQDAAPSRALFVYGLPHTITSDSVSTIFKPFGALEKVFVHVADEGKLRSYAIVTYVREEDAVRAKNGLDKQCLFGEGTAIQVSFKAGGAK